MDDHLIYKTTGLLRLLLLAQLIDKTGVLWRISIDRCSWDVKFSCRYGFGKYEVLDVNISLTKSQEYIEDTMNDVSWEVVMAYGYRQKTKYDWASSQDKENKND